MSRLQKEIWQWELNLEAARSYECRDEIMEAHAMISRLKECQRTIRKWAYKDWEPANTGPRFIEVG